MANRLLTWARRHNKSLRIVCIDANASIVDYAKKVSRREENILFKVNGLDPIIYFTVAGMLTLVAAASCFVPARRATRVNPMVALRTE